MFRLFAYCTALAALLSAPSCIRRTPAPADEPLPAGHKILLTDSLLLHGGADTLRLGRLCEGETASVTLSVENATDRPSVPLQHELTCGCIDLTYDRKPLMPGDRLVVRVDFDTRGLYGWQMKYFRILFSGAEKPLGIYVEAEVEQ